MTFLEFQEKIRTGEGRDPKGDKEIRALRGYIRKAIADNFILSNKDSLSSEGKSKSQIKALTKEHPLKVFGENNVILHNPDQVADGSAMIGQLYNDGDITDATSLKASELVRDRGCK